MSKPAAKSSDAEINFRDRKVNVLLKLQLIASLHPEHGDIQTERKDIREPCTGCTGQRGLLQEGLNDWPECII